MSVKERIKGFVEEVKGAAKEKVGHLAGKPDLESQGRSEKLEGQVRQGFAKAEEHAKGTAQEAIGGAKQTVGELAEDPKTQLEGKVDELAGKLRQKANE